MASSKINDDIASYSALKTLWYLFNSSGPIVAGIVYYCYRYLEAFDYMPESKEHMYIYASILGLAWINLRLSHKLEKGLTDNAGLELAKKSDAFNPFTFYYHRLIVICLTSEIATLLAVGMGLLWYKEILICTPFGVAAFIALLLLSGYYKSRTYPDWDNYTHFLDDCFLVEELH